MAKVLKIKILRIENIILKKKDLKGKIIEN